MPELPEVETVVRDLRRHLVGCCIVRAEVRLPKMVQMPLAAFRTSLAERKIRTIRRRAKMILIGLDNRTTLIIHLKMTGQLVYVPVTGAMRYGGHHIAGGLERLPNRYTRVIIHLEKGDQLYFNDLRQFGYLVVMPDEELPQFFLQKKLGLEPFDRRFTFAHFLEIMKRRNRAPVKSVLLDQSVVAGLGNIYVDEVLFAARIRPTRRVQSLTVSEIASIYRHIPRILTLAIRKRGTTFRSYRDGTGQPGGMLAHLHVYGREGKPCPRCRTAIRRIKQGSRSSHYCPVCQK